MNDHERDLKGRLMLIGMKLTGTVFLLSGMALASLLVLYCVIYLLYFTVVYERHAHAPLIILAALLVAQTAINVGDELLFGSEG